MNGKTFERVVDNIRMMVRKKKVRKSKVTIGTGFLTFPEVNMDMLRFVKISREAGVDYAQFRPLLKKFNEMEFNSTPQNDIVKKIYDCRKLATENFDVLCSSHKYGSMQHDAVRRRYTVCHGHNFAAVIAADKKMYICCHMRGMPQYCIGDLGRNTLEEIWKSKKRKKIFEGINFADCPLLCRCDGFNTILWDILQPAGHRNFL
jgi:radical SAM protein with 4Fe4S-binding SPASM domain